jgi:DNA-binding PadR family transcriptional regulator
MQSLVNWAVLGLVIERPSYAYELARRFERIYQGSLALSSVSHAYAAIRALQERGLVEELSSDGAARQPRPHYRATAIGMERYREWLASQPTLERLRRHLFTVQLAVVAGHSRLALEIVDHCEQRCLERARAHRADGKSQHPDDGAELRERLAAEEERQALDAWLMWLGQARRELKPLTPDRR